MAMSHQTLEDRLARAASAIAPPALDLAAAARAEGLADVAYAIEPSPLGDLLVAVTPQGVVKISYVDRYSSDAVLEQMAARARGPGRARRTPPPARRVLRRAPARLRPAARLDADSGLHARGARPHR